MIRDGFPEFEVSVGVDFANPFVASMVLALRCTRCGETHFVFEEPWSAGEHISGSTKTRSCPYCMRTSRPPNEEDDVETDPQSRSEHEQEFMEETSSEARGFTEDPEGETLPQLTGEPEEGDDPQTAEPGDPAPSDAPQEGGDEAVEER